MTFPIQKALHYHDAKDKRNFIFGTRAIMTKLDGWFTYIDFIDGKFSKLCSSSGREIPAFEHLNEIFSSLNLAQSTLSFGNFRLIFEATIPDTPFHIANGIFNRKSELALDTVLNLHDLVILGNSLLPFSTRYNYAKQFVQWHEFSFDGKLKLIPILLQTIFPSEMVSEYQKVISTGGEGVIAKEISKPYTFGKRNSDILKLKEELTKDMLVVDLQEGVGKYENLLGALIVKGANGVLVTVSGMTDEDRELWWHDPSLILGKVVEVKAMKELPDGTLREPRFKAVRWDKSSEDLT